MPYLIATALVLGLMAQLSMESCLLRLLYRALILVWLAIMSRELLLIGDSNVRRFYSKLGSQVQLLEFAQARSLEELNTAIQTVKASYKIVVFAFITNLIVNCGEENPNPIDRAEALEDLFHTTISMIRLVIPLFLSL